MDSSATINSEVETYLITQVKNELKQILKGKKPTPPNPNAAQQLWSIKLTINGRRIKFTGKTEKALYANIIKHFTQPTTTCRDVFNTYLQEAINIQESTKTRKNQHWNRHLTCFNNLPISSLTTDVINDTIDRLLKDGISHKELQQVINPIRCICNTAVKNKIISINPMNNVHVDYSQCIRSKAETETDEDRIFLPDEMEKIIEYCNLPHQDSSSYDLIKILRLTGMRVGEAVALKWQDLNETDGTIRIHAREIKLDRSRVAVTEGTKGTRKKDKYVIERTIPVTPEVFQIFQHVREYNSIHNYHDDDFIFLGKNGRTHIRAVGNALTHACIKCGLTTIKSPHDIRRTVATALYHNGVSLKLIQKFLGHADIDTTKKYIYNYSDRTEFYATIRANI